MFRFIKNKFSSSFDQNVDEQRAEILSSTMSQVVEIQGSWDRVPDSAGPFGSNQSPIPVNGIDGEVIYLNRLSTTQGSPFFYHRLGSIETAVTGHPSDVFELASIDGTRWAFIVLSPYHFRRSVLPPPDMRLRPWPKSKIDQTFCRVPGFGMMQPVKDFPMGLPEALANSDDLNGISRNLGSAMGRQAVGILGPDRSKWRRPIGHVPPDAVSWQDVLRVFTDESS